MQPYFFFSYSHADARASEGPYQEDGRRLNYVDCLFDDLCHRVSALNAVPHSETGYRDVNKLSIGDNWSPQLVRNLSVSKVLVCLVSPNYLKDPNGSCGKEVEVFLKRHSGLAAGAVPQTMRIIPIFWENIDDCWRLASDRARGVFRQIHYSQSTLPRGYPVMGLHQLRRTRPSNHYDEFIFTIGQRITELSALPLLPDAENLAEFDNLVSAFADEAGTAAKASNQREPVKVSELVPSQGIQARGSLPRLSSAGSI